MNHLKGERSPYLLQHAGNPVDWYPWGEEAFDRARHEDRPIFLSIGYSTCHWCHVMERESFEDPDVAELMNDTFVSIKVDREERPDLDDHFMAVSQMLTRSGGWPLTIVMTPEARPFFAATYIPRDSLSGRAGMLDLVPRIAETWKNRRAEVLSSADSIAAEIAQVRCRPGRAAGAVTPPLSLVRPRPSSRTSMRRTGVSAAPRSSRWRPSTRFSCGRGGERGDARLLAMVEQSLAAMRNGGVYDQLGFGFHRYSTDPEWLVPHFEKMLYDQALLAIAYTEAWQATGKEFFRQVAPGDPRLRAARHALARGRVSLRRGRRQRGRGGQVLPVARRGDHGHPRSRRLPAFGRTYGIRETGANILHRHPDDTSAPGSAEGLLLAARNSRVRPFRDDKILTDWNGLMIAALARAGSAFGDAELTAAAEQAASFFLDRMRRPDGRLLHRFRDGEAGIPAFSDDYAFLSWGLLELYGATFDPRWLQEAGSLTDALLAHFWDAADGGFFQTADDASDSRAARRKSISDGVLPSANSAALLVLTRLAGMTGKAEYRRKAEQVAALYPGDAEAASISFGAFFSALDLLVGPSFEVVVVGDPAAGDTKSMLRELSRRFLPHATVILRPTTTVDPPITRLAPFTTAQVSLGGRATAYVCEAGSCRLPTTDVGVMLAHLGEE